MNIMKFVIHFCALIVLFTAVVPFANGEYLDTYFTTDESAIHVCPMDPDSRWTPTNEGGEFTVNLQEGDSLWISCMNRNDDDRFKWFAVKLYYPFIGYCQYWWTIDRDEVQGFKDASDDLDKKAWSTVYDNTTWNASSESYHYLAAKMVPQPHWERIKVTAARDFGGDKTFTVKMYSHCSDQKPDWFNMGLITYNASFGAPGAVAGNPHVTQIWMFPEKETVDTAKAPSFQVDPSSGSWTPDFVWVDPEGNPRPGGGVRWVTDGEGLDTSHHYSSRFFMTDRVDDMYTFYAYLEEQNDYMRFKCRNTIYDLSATEFIGGEDCTITATDGKPLSSTYLVYGLAGTGNTYIPSMNVILDLEQPKLLTWKTSDYYGRTIWDIYVPPRLIGTSIWLQAVQYDLASNVVFGTVK